MTQSNLEKISGNVFMDMGLENAEELLTCTAGRKILGSAQKVML